jgi:hypothetical protein
MTTIVAPMSPIIMRRMPIMAQTTMTMMMLIRRLGARMPRIRVPGSWSPRYVAARSCSE